MRFASKSKSGSVLDPFRELCIGDARTGGGGRYRQVVPMWTGNYRLVAGASQSLAMT